MAGFSDRKVIVVGLDAATLDLIKPWMADGKLPNLATYFSHGCYGFLRSTIHPLSPQAWASFQTGMNPGKHGIFDFRILDLNSEGYVPISASAMTGKPYWRILSDNGYKVAVINLMPSFPPSEVNGILITDRLTPPGANFTYPPELAKEIEDRVGGYTIEINDRRYIPDRDISEEEFVKLVRKAIVQQTKAANYLFNYYEWDLFLIVFTALDVVQHFYWKYADPTHPDHNTKVSDTMRFAILNVYQQLDTFIGELENRLDDRTTRFVVSDHGFGPLHGMVNLNRWLYEAGLQQPREDSSHADVQTIFRNVARRLLPRLLRAAIKRVLPRRLWRELKAFEELPIDWAHTRAYSWGDFGNIFINLRGREPLGIVEPGEEYEALRDQIAARLMELVNPVTHRNIVGKVHKREDLFHGPHVMSAPDLVVQWSDYTWMEYHSLSPNQPLFPETEEGFYRNIRISGTHRENGIILVKGPAIRKGFEVSNARIMDVAPTILHLMGLSIPSDMDGTVLTNLFEASFLDNHPVTYDDKKTFLHQSQRDSRSVYSNKEAAEIKKHLRQLGYI